jgi:hypothetical protein
VQRPAVVDIRGLPFHRHQDRDELLLTYLKCVRAVSSLNAGLLLLEAGYVFEVHTLCRCIDECSQDVWFFAEPDGEGGGPSENQRRAFEEFFQEEWSDPNDVVGSQQPRDRVSRDKVRARIARHFGVDPANFQAQVKVIDRGFSGFVHSAHVHIMELFGGPRRGFHLRGMLGTPRIDECVESLASTTFRAMCAAEWVAARFVAEGNCGNASQVLEELRDARQRFFADGDLGGKGKPSDATRGP